jgi:hypothetical protein
MKMEKTNEIKNKMDVKKIFTIVCCLVIFSLVSWKSGIFVIAEQGSTSPESGSTSRLKTISDNLTTSSYGSTGAGSWGDWGTMWNRIYSASVWDATAGDAVVGDVLTGKKFYAGANRSLLTGTAALPIDFTNQQHSARDDNGGPNGSGAEDYQGEESTWTNTNSAADPDKVWKDERTGVYWSSVISTSMTNSFTQMSLNTCDFFNTTTYTAKGSYAGGDADCGTAINACATSTVGGRSTWYLPSQKELMQAYIDGMYNKAGTTLTTAAAFATGNFFWSSSEVSSYPDGAWVVDLNYGLTFAGNAKATGFYVRCVSRD